MSIRPAPAPSRSLTIASDLFLLVPSCLMTLAPIASAELSRPDVERVLELCGPRVVRVPEPEVARQLSSTGSDLKGRVEFAYVCLVHDHAPFAIAGRDFAFVSAIGLRGDDDARSAGERMAAHHRVDTASRGFVCANVIVQRIAARGMNPDKLDRFLLERFAAASSSDRARADATAPHAPSLDRLA